MCYSIAKLTEVNMKITHELKKERLAGMVIARKKEISCKAKTIEVPTAQRVAEEELEII